jgi:hypothetical protein
MGACGKDGSAMRTITSSPLSRRSLDSYLAELDRNNWPPLLLRALDIAKKHLDLVTAEAVVRQSIAAAHRCLQNASARSLQNSRSSALRDLLNNCSTIANCTKTTRLEKEIRLLLNAAFVAAFSSGANLETVQDFFVRSKAIVERFPNNAKAISIRKHLVATKSDITHGKIHLGGQTPKIAADYEAIPSRYRNEFETAIQEEIDRGRSLTAHDVFALLAKVLSSASLKKLGDQADLLEKYVVEIAEIWRAAGLRVGRGNSPSDPQYKGPFQHFAELILLDQRQRASRLYRPFNEDELAVAGNTHRRLPKDWKEKSSAAPFVGAPLITDRLLKRCLEAISKESI